MDTLPRYGWDFSKVFFGWGVLCYEKRISNKGCITSTSVVFVVCFLIFLIKYDMDMYICNIKAATGIIIF